MTRDKDIREPLFDFLEDTYGKVRILEEKNMGKSRADIVMVTPDLLYGIEKKAMLTPTPVWPVRSEIMTDTLT